MIIGIIAGVISFIAYCIYISTSIWGKTRPSRVTWWILTALGLLILTSSYAEGARETLWIAGSYVLGPLIVAIVSIWKGEGGWEKLDIFCSIFAILSIIIWFVFNSPLVVLIIGIGLDFVGLLPTIKKSYERPEGEDGLAWSLESIASILSLFAVTQWTFAIGIYPIYLTIANVLITALILRRFLGRGRGA